MQKKSCEDLIPEGVENAIFCMEEYKPKSAELMEAIIEECRLQENPVLLLNILV